MRASTARRVGPERLTFVTPLMSAMDGGGLLLGVFLGGDLARFEDAAIFDGDDLDEPGEDVVPPVQHGLGLPAAGVLRVAPDQVAQDGEVGRVAGRRPL